VLWKIRPMSKADEPFAYSSWLKSFRDAPAVSGVSNTVYYKCHHDLVEAILSDPNTVAHIACAPDDDSQIFGYIVGSAGVCHWVYVKHPFRTFGLARDLVALIQPKVHTTKARPSSLIGNSVYNPYEQWKFYK
jgi:hypothetical protein